jgi:heme-degrading monooxygenase HmoA
MDQQGYICTVTRIAIRGPHVLPGFYRDSAASAIAAKGTPGALKTRLLGFPLWPVYYTLTVWESEAAMRAFVKTPAHRRAMANMGRYARTGRFATFAADTPRIGWRRAFRQLRTPSGVWTRPEKAARPA